MSALSDRLTALDPDCASDSQTGLSGRSLEARVLSRCADALETGLAQAGSDAMPLLAALAKNRSAWFILLDGVLYPETEMPDDLRLDITKLASFVIRQTDAIQEDATVEAITTLITINRTVADGLVD